MFSRAASSEGIRGSFRVRFSRDIRDPADVGRLTYYTTSLTIGLSDAAMTSRAVLTSRHFGQNAPYDTADPEPTNQNAKIIHVNRLGGADPFG
jgi:hypothetical protein